MQTVSYSVFFFAGIAALLLVVGIAIAGVVIMLLPRKDRSEK